MPISAHNAAPPAGRVSQTSSQESAAGKIHSQSQFLPALSFIGFII
jgi:hypothetical protein